MVEIDDDLEFPFTDDGLIDGPGEAFPVEIYDLRQFGDAARFHVVGAAEVFLVKDALDVLPHGTGKVESFIVQENYFGYRRIKGRLAEMNPSLLAERLQLVAGDRQRHHFQVAHVDAGGKNSPQEAALQHS